jgi:hypothetical protein
VDSARVTVEEIEPATMPSTSGDDEQQSGTALAAALRELR